MISDRLWRTYFAADPQVIGRAIVFFGRSYTVVGVMPSRFRYPTPGTDVWTPRSVLSELDVGRNVRNQRFLEVVARLGLLGSFALTRLVASLLYQTTPYDLVTFAAVPAVIAVVAFMACALPAWRAARVEPITALHAE